MTELARVGELVPGLLADLGQRVVKEGQREPDRPCPTVEDALIGATGVGARFRHCTLDALTRDRGNEAAIRAAHDFLADPSTGLLLRGPVGTGKTHILAAITRELALRRQTVLFRATCDLLLEIKETYGDGSSQTEDTLLRRYAGASVLVLDDLGAERTTDWAKQIFYTLINRRYNAARPLLVSTNLSLGAIEQVFGERVVSRLVGMCRVIEISGEDYRLKRREATLGTGER